MRVPAVVKSSSVWIRRRARRGLRAALLMQSLLLPLPVLADPAVFHATCNRCSEAQAQATALALSRHIAEVGDAGATAAGAAPQNSAYTIYVYDFTLAALRYYGVTREGHVQVLMPDGEVSRAYQAAQQFVSRVMTVAGPTAQTVPVRIPVPAQNPLALSSARGLAGHREALAYLGALGFEKALAPPLSTLTQLEQNPAVSAAAIHQVQRLHLQFVFADQSIAGVQIRLSADDGDALSPIPTYALEDADA